MPENWKTEVGWSDVGESVLLQKNKNTEHGRQPPEMAAKRQPSATVSILFQFVLILFQFVSNVPIVSIVPIYNEDRLPRSANSGAWSSSPEARGGKKWGKRGMKGVKKRKGYFLWSLDIGGWKHLLSISAAFVVLFSPLWISFVWTTSFADSKQTIIFLTDAISRYRWNRRVFQP